jgi:hypothetical protein
MICPDLSQFADRYRLTWDASRQGRERDPWLRQILTPSGHIYPHGPGELAVSLDGRRGITVKALVAIGCKLLQDGTDGANLSFPVVLFDAVARIVKPRRKRQAASPEIKVKTPDTQGGSASRITSDGVTGTLCA